MGVKSDERVGQFDQLIPSPNVWSLKWFRLGEIILFICYINALILQRHQHLENNIRRVITEMQRDLLRRVC